MSPFKVRDEEVRNMSDHDLLIMIHERNADMKEDLAAVLGKVLSVCEKQSTLSKNVAAIDARCDGHRDFPERIRALQESDIKLQKDLETLAIQQQQLDASNSNNSTRILALEDNVRLVSLTWKTVWGNNVLRVSFISILLSVIGIYWGRVGQYGWHVVGSFLVAILVVASLSHFHSSKNRANAKRMLKL